jgi:hypothetical protein
VQCQLALLQLRGRFCREGPGLDAGRRRVDRRPGVIIQVGESLCLNFFQIFHAGR